ncbi:MAG TPA: MFS transporter [Streptosporangiaceae bacterium]|nr:MFS transporter [Streptosporangiaceae bacterium]
MHTRSVQPDQAPNTTDSGRASFLGDLRTVLAGQGFRRLYATRLISQTGDGIYTAGLGTYVFFNATSFPNPAAAAISFAVLYLPYSLVGPFAGVFIDRWSRRQILFWSALARAGFVVLGALFIATGALGAPILLAALIVLGVNRFFLSALSAALPHVVGADELVMANSVGPTSGTVAAFIGGIAGTGVHLATGGGPVGSAITLCAAGMCYVAASLAATRMPRTSLGPTPSEEADHASVGAELENVAAGLISGLRHVWERRPARAALIATTAQRFLYGILLLMSILLYRNYFYPGTDGNTALAHFLPVIVSTAIGYGAAAWLTPVATNRMSNAAWVTSMLALGGVVTGTLGLTFSQGAYVAIGFMLGVVAQGITISTTTILQQETTDEFRGRVFSVNDMLYNTSFVVGAAACAGFMPDSGHSPAMLIVAAAGYLAAAAGYWFISSYPRPDSLAQRSSSSTARS